MTLFTDWEGVIDIKNTGQNKIGFLFVSGVGNAFEFAQMAVNKKRLLFVILFHRMKAIWAKIQKIKNGKIRL
jgi:hypothetical protein